MKQCLIQLPENGAKLPETAHFLGLSNADFAGGVWRQNCPNDLQLPENVQEELRLAKCDFAILDARPFHSFGLVVSDMDSTLITIECIDEIAAQAGLKERVAEITERAMRGELDFSQSLIERVALLKGLPESVLQTVYQEKLRLSEGAEKLIAECKKHNIKFLLVSGGFTFFTDKLQQKLGLDWAYANRLEIDENGLLTGKVIGEIIDAQKKAELLQKHRDQLGLRQDQVIAVGDGANDIPMFQAAGIGIAFHAKPKARQAADLCIDHRGLDALRHWFE